MPDAAEGLQIRNEQLLTQSGRDSGVICNQAVSLSSDQRQIRIDVDCVAPPEHDISHMVANSSDKGEH
jgi:hypothetical protein